MSWPEPTTHHPVSLCYRKKSTPFSECSAEHPLWELMLIHSSLEIKTQKAENAAVATSEPEKSLDFGGMNILLIMCWQKLLSYQRVPK